MRNMTQPDAMLRACLIHLILTLPIEVVASLYAFATRLHAEASPRSGGAVLAFPEIHQRFERRNGGRSGVRKRLAKARE